MIDTFKNEDGNYNYDITLKVLSDEDIYDGMYVQSVGNRITIYQLKFIEGVLHYRPTHNIIHRIPFKTDSEIEKTDGATLQFVARPATTIVKAQWAITCYSQKADPVYIRNQKLESIGI